MEIDIRHVARLSRLKVTEEGLPKFEKNMADMLKMIENLPEIKDGGALIDPDDKMDLRADEAGEKYSRDELLKGAPMTEAGCVVVPRTIDFL